MISYEAVARSRTGHELHLQLASAEPPRIGDIVEIRGQRWIVDEVVGGDSGGPRLVVKPARYRLVLRHPGGREEAGSFRRFRGTEPGLGHAFTTLTGDGPASWQVVEQRPARDELGEPFVELVAERDYGEFETLPDHELEHALLAGGELPEGAAAALARASEQGMHMEMVALDPGRQPDWAEAERFIEALVPEEIGEDLLELCRVDPELNPGERLEHVQQRLRSDLEAFRADVEGDHDEIQEWDWDGVRIFSSVGTWDDEADPDRGHGWMCRLFDSDVLGAAGFTRVRKAELQGPPET